MCKPKIRMIFSKADDEKLKKAVNMYGTNSWHEVSKRVYPFSPRQCKFRYEVYLQGSFRKAPWTDEEDKLLDLKYQEYGRNWMKMVPFFNGRNANNLKNRFYRHHKNVPVMVESDKGIDQSKTIKTEENISPIKEEVIPSFDETIQFSADSTFSVAPVNDEILYNSFTELFDSFNDSNWGLDTLL